MKTEEENKVCFSLDEAKNFVKERFLEYEEWYVKFEDEINIELAETGADRQMDFDGEREFDKRYDMYLNAR